MPPKNAAVRYHRGWTGASRSDIIRKLVVTIDRYEDVTSLIHGSALAVHELMAASTVSVTLIIGDEFIDIVNVGYLGKGQVAFPEDQRYPLSEYPAAAERLLSHRGYLSTESLAVVEEYIAQLPYAVPECFMGVPIVAGGEVLGELFLSRQGDQPAYTHEDIELAIDVATVIGSRLADVTEMELESPRPHEAKPGPLQPQTLPRG
jgi:hypothetical protein